MISDDVLTIEPMSLQLSPKPSSANNYFINLLNSFIYYDDGFRGRLKSAQNSPCTSCNAAVKKQDEGVHGDRCDEWWHRACTDIPQQIYDHLSSVRGIMWACANCLDDAKTAMKTSIRD